MSFKVLIADERKTGTPATSEAYGFTARPVRDGKR
jgi:hypothetical protein